MQSNSRLMHDSMNGSQIKRSMMMIRRVRVGILTNDCSFDLPMGGKFEAHKGSPITIDTYTNIALVHDYHVELDNEDYDLID